MAKRFRDEDVSDSFVTELTGLPQRKKSAPRKTVNIDPTGFGEAADIGFTSTPEQKKTATTGIKTTGASLAKEFAGLRPKKKKIATGLSTTSPVEEAETGLTVTQGRKLTPSVRKEIAGEAGSEISEAQRRKQGLGGGGSGFGLPTDRLPTIEELGGALGGIAKFVSQLSKRNRARGLVPGFDITKTKGAGQSSGLTKATMTSLTKRLELATLSGDTEKANKIEAQLDAISQGKSAGAFAEEEEDAAAIAGL